MPEQNINWNIQLFVTVMWLYACTIKEHTQYFTIFIYLCLSTQLSGYNKDIISSDISIMREHKVNVQNENNED